MKRNGFSLIEVTIATAVITAVIAAGALMIGEIMRGNQENIARLTAQMLAEEGIEAIRVMRDTHALNHTDWLGDPVKNFWSDGTTLKEGGSFIVWRRDSAPCAACTTRNLSDGERITLMKQAAPFAIGRATGEDSMRLMIDSGAFTHLPHGFFSGFWRRVEVTPYGDDRIGVKSIVEWDNQKKSVALETELTNWHP